MATLTYLSNIQTASQSHTGDTNAYSVPGTSVTLLANTTYLIFAFGELRGSSVGDNFGMSLAIESTGYNTHQLEPSSANSWYSYFSVYEHTVGGTAETAKIWIWTLDSAETVYADQVGVVAWDISDWSKGATASNDYNLSYTSGSSTVSTSETNIETVGFRTSTAADVWLLMSMAQFDHTAGRIFRSRIRVDSDTASDYAEQEAEDSVDRYFAPHFRIGTFSADTDHTLAISAWKTAAQGTCNIRNRTCLAINLSRIFSNFEYSFTEGDVALAASWGNIETVSDNGTGNDAFLFSYCQYQPSDLIYSKFRQQLDNSDNPATQTSDTHQRNYPWETTDRIPVTIVGVESSMSTSSHTLDLDAERGDVGNAAQRRLVLILSSDLIAAGIPATATAVDVKAIALDASATVTAESATSIRAEANAIALQTPAPTVAAEHATATVASARAEALGITDVTIGVQATATLAASDVIAVDATAQVTAESATSATATAETLVIDAAATVTAEQATATITSALSFALDASATVAPETATTQRSEVTAIALSVTATVGLFGNAQRAPVYVVALDATATVTAEQATVAAAADATVEAASVTAAVPTEQATAQRAEAFAEALGVTGALQAVGVTIAADVSAIAVGVTGTVTPEQANGEAADASFVAVDATAASPTEQATAGILASAFSATQASATVGLIASATTSDTSVQALGASGTITAEQATATAVSCGAIALPTTGTAPAETATTQRAESQADALDVINAFSGVAAASTRANCFAFASAVTATVPAKQATAEAAPVAFFQVADCTAAIPVVAETATLANCAIAVSDAAATSPVVNATASVAAVTAEATSAIGARVITGNASFAEISFLPLDGAASLVVQQATATIADASVIATQLTAVVGIAAAITAALTRWSVNDIAVIPPFVVGVEDTWTVRRTRETWAVPANRQSWKIPISSK